MRLFNCDDVAVELNANKNEIDAILYQEHKSIYETQKAIVKLVGENVINLDIGDSVYIDPNGASFIEELNLIICHKHNILVKDEK